MFPPRSLQDRTLAQLRRMRPCHTVIAEIDHVLLAPPTRCTCHRAEVVQLVLAFSNLTLLRLFDSSHQL
eukprot:1317382-Amorphochlora_amoeboformis.AAC.1